MIEGLILLSELVVFGLLLWRVRQLDDPTSKAGLGIFGMKMLDAGTDRNAKEGRARDHA